MYIKDTLIPELRNINWYPVMDNNNMLIATNTIVYSFNFFIFFLFLDTCNSILINHHGGFKLGHTEACGTTLSDHSGLETGIEVKNGQYAYPQNKFSPQLY